MSDGEAPVETRGGPSWRRHELAAAPGAAAPAAAPSGASPGGPLPAAPPRSPAVVTLDASELDEELYHPRYSRNSGTAVPYGIVALVLMGAAWWGLRWSTFTPDAPDPVRTSEWWTNITSVVLPSEDIRFASYSQSRMWISLSLLLLATGAVMVWIGRIGSNLRTTEQPFGSVLPAIALLAWWVLPITIGVTTDSGRSREDLLVRYLLAFGMLFAQFLLLRWPMLNRIWRAGHLPYDLASIVLWLPMMAAWSMWFLSNIFTLLTIGDDGRLADSSWRPTPAMIDWIRHLTRATGVGILILLVVVSITQHIGLRKDRAAASASRERSRAERLPLLPPGL